MPQVYHIISAFILHSVVDFTISGGNLLTTIPTFKKEYKISAIVKFNSFSTNTKEDSIFLKQIHRRIWYLQMLQAQRAKSLKSARSKLVFTMWSLDWQLFNFDDNICTQTLLWFVWHDPSLKAKRVWKVKVADTYLVSYILTRYLQGD